MNRIEDRGKEKLRKLYRRLKTGEVEGLGTAVCYRIDFRFFIPARY